MAVNPTDPNSKQLKFVPSCPEGASDLDNQNYDIYADDVIIASVQTLEAGTIVFRDEKEDVEFARARYNDQNHGPPSPIVNFDAWGESIWKTVQYDPFVFGDEDVWITKGGPLEREVSTVIFERGSC
jgi:hypothetical protein